MIFKIKNENILIDDEDYDKIKDYKWHISMIHGYKRVKTCFYINKKRITIYLHRFIMNVSKDKQVDHKNHNTLDNRKCNLRICTSQQNTWNQAIHKNNTSGIKGVCWHKARNKYNAKIAFNSKNMHIEYFDSKEDAKNAYNKKALELYGEFAYLN